ncbi:MAG: hypothetical protein ACYDAG_13015 [Chloroflexota bacterium]
MIGEQKKWWTVLAAFVALVLAMESRKERVVPSAEGRPSRYRAENEDPADMDDLFKRLERRRQSDPIHLMVK